MYGAVGYSFPWTVIHRSCKLSSSKDWVGFRWGGGRILELANVFDMANTTVSWPVMLDKPNVQPQYM